jgi:hypothetical protein
MLLLWRASRFGTRKRSALLDDAKAGWKNGDRHLSKIIGWQAVLLGLPGFVGAI